MLPFTEHCFCLVHYQHFHYMQSPKSAVMVVLQVLLHAQLNLVLRYVARHPKAYAKLCVVVTVPLFLSSALRAVMVAAQLFANHARLTIQILPRGQQS